jgi:CMP-N-acetylneuraminic acid synthetase
MINDKRVLALITARVGSKGLPGKNTHLFCGKPLIGWTIEQALGSKYIDKVLVTTDGEEIAQISREYGAEVPFMRPANLASDGAQTIDVLLHAINFLEAASDQYDILVLLEPTSPLRECSDIDGSIELCVSQVKDVSVVSVFSVENAHPSFMFEIEGSYLRPTLNKSPTGVRRQDLQREYYCIEGCVYVSPVEMLKVEKSFYHKQTMPWLVDRYKAIEIDELSDLIMAQALMTAKIKGILK